MVTISVSLKDHDTLSPDDEIAEGVVVWEPRNENLTFANYDKLLEKVVKGQYGSVTVGYSITRFDMNATVRVVLINGDRESPVDVYGSIKATSVLDGGSPLITLFEKSAGDSVKVNLEEEIPLTRSAVVVPMDDGVTISAYLYDHDSISSDDETATSCVSFHPSCPGTTTSTISGVYGQVQVSITAD
ncbi:unnamed protein product [Cuscuta europaea]|uniref:DUF6598 domain-containing protein n=1 Tax=Cuscuta europaea TaxID=41803 RepID=A0A9P1E079_CUSEU|nr:unnamed protein product [Cuscuta europaea]